MYVGLATKHMRQAFVSDETVEEEGKLPSICRYYSKCPWCTSASNMRPDTHQWCPAAMCRLV